MVLADREYVESELVGELDLLEQIEHPLARAHAGREVREGGQTEFHFAKHIKGSCARNYRSFGWIQGGAWGARAARRPSNLQAVRVLTTGPIPSEPLLAAAQQGDEHAFRRLVEPHRAELEAHCYRMLGSVHDAEEALQESMLRAWRGLAGFERRSSLRSWLYTIATNTCLNLIARRPKRVLPVEHVAPTDPHAGPGEPLLESIWLEPYPDSRLAADDGVATPEARYEQRESVELAFIAALQGLPANQRAVLILREVLGFSARESAESLATTVASVNSALQRARRAVEDRMPARSQQATLRALGDERLSEIVDGYVEAWERGDVETVVAMLTEDASFAMPPLASWFSGREALRIFLSGWPLSGLWRWRHERTSANGQPALAFYCWDEAEQAYMPFALNVLTLRGEQISDVTAFVVRSTERPEREVYAHWPEQPADPLRLAATFGRFGLPERLP
jgi:RNA polymerase sigma-70 factor, ECF subfamily